MVLRKAMCCYIVVAVFMGGLLSFPLQMKAQKLRVNAYDKYERKWRMETVPESLKSSEEAKMDIAFGAADTSLFLQLSGSGTGSNTVGPDNQVIFVFDDDSSVTAISQSLQALDYNKLPLTYHHQYSLRINDLEGLTRHRLKALRKYSLGGVDDIFIDAKNAGKLREVSSFFISELKKHNLVPEKPPVMPATFPGGNAVLLQFLNRNVKSISSLQTGDKKTVVLQFMVAADGSITNAQVKAPADPLVDKEALRLLSRMPKWKPASENGKEVAFMITQPITFYKTDTSVTVLF